MLYLYGVNNTVSTVGSPYVDPGAISYDLSYGIQNVTGTGTVNSDTIGTYTISYDAPDFAGNPANYNTHRPRTTTCTDFTDK